jgi:hypothetical protein
LWPWHRDARRPLGKASEFVLVDANDKPIAELGVAQEGSGLVLMDSLGNPRAALVLTQTGEPGLKLYDRASIVRAALMVASACDEGTKTRAASVGASSDERGSLTSVIDRQLQIIVVDKIAMLV